MGSNDVPPRPRLLVIDDELGIRDLLRFTFGPVYDVVIAGTGDDGLEECRRKAFDLIILDLAMPVKDGVETLVEIKKFFPETEIVVVTGKVGLSTVVECIKNGAYDYVMKPFDLDYLRAIVGKALEHRRMAARLGGLERINQVKSELLSTIGSQLSKPAHAILHRSQALLRGAETVLPQPYGGGLKEIESLAQNLTGLIGHLFDLSSDSEQSVPPAPPEWQGLLDQLSRAKQSPSASVLVVDDDAFILQLFGILLRRQGYSVETALDGREALQKMNAKIPTILILDLMMPRMSGFELLEAMAKKPEFSEVHVFVVTAKHLTADENKYLEKRVDAIILKGKQDIGEVLPMLKERIAGLQSVSLHSKSQS